MINLFIVSILWAPSFGLIEEYLTGLDPNFVALVRIFISFIVFLPFIRLARIKATLVVYLMFIGAIQFGVMYVTYIQSFRYLDAHEVALYTIFTPLYVTLFNDLLDMRHRWTMFGCALLAFLGGFIVLRGDIGDMDLTKGFGLMQISNLCFACGQVLYKRALYRHPEIEDRQIFGILYLGALMVTGTASAFTTKWPTLMLNRNEILTLLYLGILASGICFFLWNAGARRVHAGTLAVFNNLKVPLAVACALLIFKESGDVTTLAIGGGLILTAIHLNERAVKREEREEGKRR